MHELRTSLVLPISLDEAWAFFSVPDNLDDITPPDMGFEILTDNEKRTYAGQIIRYRVRPLFNIPMTWVTEITHCEDRAYFVDEQRFGPYAMWHHQHHFKEVEGGVQMDDILHYKLKWGQTWGAADRVDGARPGEEHLRPSFRSSAQALRGQGFGLIQRTTIDTTHWRPTLPSGGQASPLN